MIICEACGTAIKQNDPVIMVFYGNYPIKSEYKRDFFHASCHENVAIRDPNFKIYYGTKKSA